MVDIVIIIGTDLVHVSGLREQLARPGAWADSAFTVRERRRARRAPDEAEHLAGRWAAKEAFIKAWAQSRYGAPPLLPRDSFPMSAIEVVADAYGRVAIELHEPVAGAAAGLGEVSLSISHDGDYAIAQCLVARP